MNQSTVKPSGMLSTSTMQASVNPPRFAKTLALVTDIANQQRRNRLAKMRRRSTGFKTGRLKTVRPRPGDKLQWRSLRRRIWIWDDAEPYKFEIVRGQNGRPYIRCTTTNENLTAFLDAMERRVQRDKKSKRPRTVRKQKR
jgi:hypothetical protein